MSQKTAAMPRGSDATYIGTPHALSRRIKRRF